MKNTFIYFLLFISRILVGQECKIDLHALAQPDINMSQFNKFGQSRFFKIVLSKDFDTVANKEVINQLSQWYLNQNSKIYYVNINSIKKIEDSCHYLIIGLTKKLSDLDIFDLPVKLKDSTFIIGNIQLSNPYDALSIINKKANCIAVIGNSYAAIKNISNGRFIGLYDFYIVKNNKMAYLGNLNENKVVSNNILDLELIRKENYPRKICNELIEAYFSCKFNSIEQFQNPLDSLINIFNDFCKLYGINKPSRKLKYFVHQEQLEINIVCGDPKPGTTSGLVIDSLIHTVGLDEGLLIHEGIHFIFNTRFKTPNAFFNEGIPTSFALFLHPDQTSKDCKVIQDDLDIKDLVTGKKGFWFARNINGQCLSYQISGLFVKFLIDRYGIDKLKEFYQYTDVLNGFKDIYKLELEEVLKEWRAYVLKNIK